MLDHQHAVRLDENGTSWGPFADPTIARRFAAFIRDDVDPASTVLLRDPIAELLTWRDRALGRERELTDQLADLGRQIAARDAADVGRPVRASWTRAAREPIGEEMSRALTLHTAGHGGPFGLCNMEPCLHLDPPARMQIDEAVRPDPVSVADDRLARIRVVLREAGIDIAAMADEPDGVAQLLRAAVRLREQMQAVNLTPAADAVARATHLRELLDMGRAIIERARDAMRVDDLDVVGLGDLDVEVGQLVEKYRRLRDGARIGDEVLDAVVEILNTHEVSYCGTAADGVTALADRAAVVARRAGDAEHHLERIVRDLGEAGFGPGMAPVLVAAALAELVELRMLRQLDIARLDLAPGDTIVAQARFQLSDDEAAQIGAVMSAKFPGHRTAVIDTTVSLAAVRMVPPATPAVPGGVVWGVRPSADMRRTMGWPEILWCDGYDDALSLVRDDAVGVWGWFAADGTVAVHPWPAGTGRAAEWPPAGGDLGPAVDLALENLPTGHTLDRATIATILRMAVKAKLITTGGADGEYQSGIEAVARLTGAQVDWVDGIVSWAGMEAGSLIDDDQDDAPEGVIAVDVAGDREAATVGFVAVMERETRRA